MPRRPGILRGTSSSGADSPVRQNQKDKDAMNDSNVSKLVSWTTEENPAHGPSSFIIHHRLHETGLFSEDALVRMLDSYPRAKLQVFTMGADPEDRSEWQPVDTTGASGREILEAVRVGRLWVKLMRVDQNVAAVGEVMTRTYDELQRLPGFPQMLWLRPLLLISSPGALVYYHADPQPTMLWQLSGSKRVWIYPANDRELLAPSLLEQIYAGEVDEEAPYSRDFDQRAAVYDLVPGELLCWPLNAPHRVVNHDSVNVSLSVPYGTHGSEKRAQLYFANLMLRRKLGVGSPSTSEAGGVAIAKRFMFRGMRRLNLVPRVGATRKPYMASLRIDAASAGGLARIPSGPVRTPF